MSSKNIEIIQNILKQQNRYDLSLYLESSYYDEKEDDYIRAELSGIIIVYVHPNNYLKLQKLPEKDKDLLLDLFRSFYFKYDFVEYIEYKINNQINISNINNNVYIFFDEAGDLDFSKNGSKYYMFNFLIKKRPFNLHEIISNYRYSLLERNLDPLNDKRLDIESFHACHDNKYIKSEIFKLISTFSTDDVQAYSYILEKPKVTPTKREEKDKFYVENLNLAIKKLLDKLNINKNLIIITDRLPIHKNKKKQIGALKRGIKEYIKDKKLEIRYDIFHHCGASSVNLQIVDYISWAIFRKYEQNQDIFYKQIEKYLIGVDNMTKEREFIHYEK